MFDILAELSVFIFVVIYLSIVLWYKKNTEENKIDPDFHKDNIISKNSDHVGEIIYAEKIAIHPDSSPLPRHLKPYSSQE
jgi:hypothetical protein